MDRNVILTQLVGLNIFTHHAVLFNILFKNYYIAGLNGLEIKITDIIDIGNSDNQKIKKSKYKSNVIYVGEYSIVYNITYI